MRFVDWLPVVLGALILIGCRPAAQIRTYTVPKERARNTTTTNSVQATDRMLAAIVPRGEQAWFFKAVGTVDVMEELADAFEDFCLSLVFEGDSAQPQWRLPEGWEETPGTGMRAATIEIPTGSDTIEMSVMQLPWDGALLANVNRWRGQLNQPQLAPAELDDVTKPLTAGNYEGTLVDLRGNYSSSSLAGPAVNRAARPVPRAAQTDRRELPRFTLPEGWQPVAPTAMVQFAFRVARDDDATLMKVTTFPATAGMADPLGNVNRWRGELQLEPVESDALEQLASPVEIDGHQGTIYFLRSTDDPPQATLVAMVQRTDEMWFFKIKGDADIVASQQEHFREFLQSVRFTPAGELERGDD